MHPPEDIGDTPCFFQSKYNLPSETFNKKVYCSNRDTAWNPLLLPGGACTVQRITAGTSPNKDVSRSISGSGLYKNSCTRAGGRRRAVNFGAGWGAEFEEVVDVEVGFVFPFTATSVMVMVVDVLLLAFMLLVSSPPLC